MHHLEKAKFLALLAMRLVAGAIFMSHGYPKLFGDTARMVVGFQSMGFPGFFVYVAGIVEFFGGLLLVAGLFTRIAGLLLAGEMVVAVLKVHLPKGLIGPGGYEFPLAMAALCFGLMVMGAGAVSLDRILFKDKA